MAKRRANDTVVAQKAAAKPTPAQILQDVTGASTVAALRAAIANLLALLGVR